MVKTLPEYQSVGPNEANAEQYYLNPELEAIVNLSETKASMLKVCGSSLHDYLNLVAE